MGPLHYTNCSLSRAPAGVYGTFAFGYNDVGGAEVNSLSVGMPSGRSFFSTSAESREAYRLRNPCWEHNLRKNAVKSRATTSRLGPAAQSQCHPGTGLAGIERRRRGRLLARPIMSCKVGCCLMKRPTPHTTKAGRASRSLPVTGIWFVVAAVISLGGCLRYVRQPRGRCGTERSENMKR